MAESPFDIRATLEALLPDLATQDDATISGLCGATQAVRLEKGRYVFHAGDRCQAFLLLLEGRVRVQLTSAAGREVTLYRIGSGGSCILTTSCLLSSERYPADALAETDVVAMAIPNADFREALDRSSHFRDMVFDGFSSRLASVIGRIEELALTSIDARLAAALIALDEVGTQQITHQELAVEVGTAREVISRHLKKFEHQGWIRLGRRQISVRDRVALRQAADSVGD